MEISRYTLNNLGEYLFSVCYDNWRSSARSKIMGFNSLNVNKKKTGKAKKYQMSKLRRID